MRNDARLAGTRTGQDQQRPVARSNCFALLFVKLRKKIQDLSFAFEELHGALVFLCGRKCVEGAEVSALAGFWVFLARIETVLS
jgi:hypothetical protein